MMKTRMNHSIKNISVALVLASITTVSFATTKVTVNGMVCAFCAQGIEKRLSKLPATKAVFVDLKQKTVAVEAKDGMTLDEKAIKAEITDAGYDVTKMEEVPQTVAELREAMKAGVAKGGGK
jgi:copper chaperone CopZ